MKYVHISLITVPSVPHRKPPLFHSPLITLSRVPNILILFLLFFPPFSTFQNVLVTLKPQNNSFQIVFVTVNTFFTSQVNLRTSHFKLFLLLSTHCSRHKWTSEHLTSNYFFVIVNTLLTSQVSIATSHFKLFLLPTPLVKGRWLRWTDLRLPGH